MKKIIKKTCITRKKEFPLVSKRYDTYRTIHMNGTYYLNNSGSRWVEYVGGKKVTHAFRTKSGKLVARTIIYFYSFGNFVAAVISYKGKRCRVLMDSILDD